MLQTQAFRRVANIQRRVRRIDRLPLAGRQFVAAGT
jgi:hypothetical protein